ncbi:L-threonine 3-dehydrogenase, partial [mine drainage metagenome]
MRTMQAVMKRSAAPGAELVEVPVPEPGPGEALVEVRAASICGTDYHVYSWDDWAAGRVHPPRIMGHETSGVIVALGPSVSGFKVGDHVSIETHITCGVCHSCRTGQGHICENVQILGVDHDGSFAKYLTIPAGNLWRNPTDMPFDVAAAQEPLGNAVHTVFAGEITGKSVLITGLGAIGLFAIGVARAAGAGKIIATEVTAYRRGIGTQMGA